MPESPEFAAWTASMDKVRIVLMESWSDWLSGIMSLIQDVFQYFSGINVFPFSVAWSSYSYFFDRSGSFTLSRFNFL